MRASRCQASRVLGVPLLVLSKMVQKIRESNAARLAATRTSTVGFYATLLELLGRSEPLLWKQRVPPLALQDLYYVFKPVEIENLQLF